MSKMWNGVGKKKNQIFGLMDCLLLDKESSTGGNAHIMFPPPLLSAMTLCYI